MQWKLRTVNIELENQIAHSLQFLDTDLMLANQRLNLHIKKCVKLTACTMIGVNQTGCNWITFVLPVLKVSSDMAPNFEVSKSYNYFISIGPSQDVQ